MPDLSALSRKDLAARYAQHQKDIKSLSDKGDGITGPEETQLATLLDTRDAVKAEMGKRPDTKAVMSRVDAGNTFLKTPHMPGGLTHAPSSPERSEGGDTKGLLENGDSEVDKFIRKGPFKSLGHFAYSVWKSGRGGPANARPGSAMAVWNDRLRETDNAVKAMGDEYPDQKAGNASGLGELTDSEGASFIPQDFAQGIWARSMEQDNLLARIGVTPVTGNNLTLFAYADDSRKDGSRMGGIQGFWEAEAQQYTKSKPTTRKIDLRLKKLTLLVWATEELLEDSPMALDAELSRLAVEEFTFKCNDSITNGVGDGIPMGYMKAPAKITVTAVSGQGTNTIVATNIDAMWAQRANPRGGNYVWLANQAVEPQLAQLNYNLGNSSVAATWLYLPQGGITQAPNPQLKGRPVIFTEQAQDLGTEGDIALVDFTQWRGIVKSSGIKQSVSMHLRLRL